ncbi:HNH endonuclease signature motif containing protein [Microbacterium sp. SLBN-146]|uniref:HNH endonuclease signature motif containing protein n=1 Tax=Microbacterium sp. SLBN-146 TaxID=2768457 RepID=UPI001166B2F0|nr:HNH endonuclease signature motif containing protein [Microbacterium sp. SLBN-146]TQJ31655.1 uncharacterized protein DUF222 [Microbacterium sp. SLBN-146]
MTSDPQYDDWATSLGALVADVAAVNRRIATLQAQQAGLLSDAVALAVERDTTRSESSRRRNADLGMREVCAELATAMRVSDRSVQLRMSDASTLTSRYPRTLTAWREGRIDAAHAGVVVDAGVVVPDELVARYEAIIVPIAESETSGRLRSIARTLAAQLAPEAVGERRQRAVDARGVRLVDLDDGIARIIADQPAVIAHGIYDRVTQMAREAAHIEAEEAQHDGEREADRGSADRGSDPEAHGGESHGDGDPAFVSGPSRESERRTIGQLRADIFADLLLAGDPVAHDGGLGSITADVQVTVPVLIEAGVGDEPCVLVGHGPIDPATALRLAGSASSWTRVLTDPVSGGVLAVDRYRPNKDLIRHLRARDEHCRFPGCRTSVLRCDVDHTIDAAAGGATTASNLSHLCRRHHTLKHHTDWTVRQRPGGILEWSSPTGQRYSDRPARKVRFVPTDWLAVATAPRPPGTPRAPF